MRFIFLMLLPLSAHAGWYVHLPITEHYAGLPYETEHTVGLGWEGGGWTAGAYRNSNRELSIYGGLIEDKGRWGYGFVAITGYKYPVTPAPFLFLDAGPLRFVALPGVINVTLALP